MFAKAKVGFAAALCAATMVLGGCGSPNMAAEVAGTQISTQQVDQTATHLQRSLQEANDSLARQAGQPSQEVPALPGAVVLNVLMRSQAADKVVQAKNIKLDQTQLDKGFNELQASEIFAKDPVTKDFFMKLLKVQLLQNQLGDQQLNQEFSKLKVQTNPRYGIRGLDELQADQQTGEPVLQDGSLSQVGGATQ